jgi:hypothetical protein
LIPGGFGFEEFQGDDLQVPDALQERVQQMMETISHILMMGPGG